MTKRIKDVQTAIETWIELEAGIKFLQVISVTPSASTRNSINKVSYPKQIARQHSWSTE